MQIHGRGFGIERIQAKVFVLRAIIEKSSVQNMFWTEVVLQAKKIVSGPLRGRIRVGR